MPRRVLKHARSMPYNLRANPLHALAASHALRIFHSNAIYSFIPKNGCSTMRLSLAIANGCIEDESDINWIHNNNDTFSADLASLMTARYTFVILRDPYARLASCFLDKIVDKTAEAWLLYNLIDRHMNIDDIAFSNFINFLADPRIRSADIHWRPQVDFLVYEQYDDYFALEQFDRSKKIIEDRAGLTIVDSRSLLRHGLDQWRLLPVDHDSSETPVGEIAALRRRGECPHPRSLFTDALISRVSELYAADLKLFTEKTGLATQPGPTGFASAI